VGDVVAGFGRAANVRPDGDGALTLTPRELRFVAALAEGATVGEAANAARVSERTGFRWKGRPEVAEAVRICQVAAIAQARGVISAGAARAGRALVAIADGAKATTQQVTAARAVVEGAERVAEVIDTAKRIEDIEARLKARGL
jgi:hypothetical protein